jgi:beta-glucosidase
LKMRKSVKMKHSAEKFVDELLGRMTLEEKIGQLNQPQGGENINPEDIRSGNVGSLIKSAGALPGKGKSGLLGVEQANQLQQYAMESRLKIPLIIGRDVIHGCRTIFPIPLAQAASFDPELAEKAASKAAQEASACGIKWTFAPMLDIARDPRWGRVAEGNGEDPFLGARMAAALVKGFQGEDMGEENKIVACAKHYAGYGSAEGGRDYENGEISEPTLRDIYLPPFKSAVQAGVGTVMSAFLDLNGTPATANRYLLSEVLRGEWGFEGFVVSDWTSITELIQHGVAEDKAEAAAKALQAGVDMDMCSLAYKDTLAENLQAGKISEKEINQAARRVLRIKQLAGLFNHPYTDPARYGHEVLTGESRQLARQFAQASMVLLKNQDNLLPLKDFHKILVAGDFVHARGELYGTWSLDGVEEDCVAFDQAITQISPKNTQIWFASDHDQALDYALEADVIVLLLGENPSRSGENANLSDLSLPPGQAHLVDLMVSLGKPVILVIFAGRPLVLTRQVQQADAMIFAWHPGIEGAAALGEILFGLTSPGGHLPITFPRATGQVPLYYNHKNSGRPVTPGGWFNSRYIDLPSSALFPFGYGLSYTSFEYNHMRLSDEIMRDSLTIQAEVTNTGAHPGNELVQLYVRDLVGSLTRPVRQLKGFQHLELQPGETRQVSFKLTEEMLAFTRADGIYGVEPGKFHVWIAANSASGLRGEFRL